MIIPRILIFAMIPIVAAAHKYGRQYNLDPQLLLSMAWVESSWRPAAKNKNCLGLYQVDYLIWKRELQLERRRMMEVDYNTAAAARILRSYIDLYKGDIWRAVHAFNNGLSGKYNNQKYVPKVRAVYELLQGKVNP